FRARVSSPVTATTHIHPLSLHDALPIYKKPAQGHFTLTKNVAVTNGLDSLVPTDAKFTVHYTWQKGDRTGSGDLPVRNDGEAVRSEEHTSELQSRFDLVCRLLLEKKNER